MAVCYFWKTKAAQRIRSFILASISLSIFLLPTLGSAQALDIRAWQKIIKDTPPSETGCFEASYPDTQWQPVACDFSQSLSLIPSGPMLSGRETIQALQQGSQTGAIGNIGYAAGAVGGPISSAEGSFVGVTGVSSITDSISPHSNVYTLQLNTNYFAIPNGSASCNNSNGCQGWVQFVYLNWGAGSKLSIWYWLRNTNSCPAQWTDVGGKDCNYEGGRLSMAELPLANFNDQVSLSGQTANGTDTVILTIGSNAYVVASSSVLTAEFNQKWQQTQFNVFGAGNHSSANFNNGSSLIISTKIDNGTANTPTCSNNTGTGEFNNLNYNSPCCAYGGGKPSIAFMEGTATGWTVPSCSALGDNTITPAVTPSGGGTISPSVALEVPNNAVSTFTVTPKPGYKIASVTGCGGTFNVNSNVFTTAPASANCNVTATFASTANPTVTLSAITPSGSASPAVGTPVSVSPNGSTTFTITPPAGMTWASWAGWSGGCGAISVASTWYVGSNLVLKVGPVTSNCTFPVTFSR
ncbi:MAG: hypothetical protein LBU72_04075 [Burkholderiaceae bacterium]|jgi:hypothetical protein|nr:hypothetical protein [Burkholderiaceae bacterium]